MLPLNSHSMVFAMQEWTYCFHLLQNFVFNADVLKHGLYDHIGILKASVIQLTSQVTQDTVPLKRRNVFLLGFVIESGRVGWDRFYNLI